MPFVSGFVLSGGLIELIFDDAPPLLVFARDAGGGKRFIGFCDDGCC